MKFLIPIFLSAIAASATGVVAVLEIVQSGDGSDMAIQEQRHLTDELRAKARESLPKSYTVLTRDNIFQLLPPGR